MSVTKTGSTHQTKNSFTGSPTTTEAAAEAKAKSPPRCHISPIGGGKDDTATQKDDVNDTPTAIGGSEANLDVLDLGDSLFEAQLKTEGEEQSSKGKNKLSYLVDHKLEKFLADLEKEEWYHGCLPFEDIVGLLKANGDFLVRELEPEGDRMAMACVTTRWDDKVRDHPVHYLQIGKERLFTLDGVNNDAQVMSLIKRHYKSAIPIDGNVILRNPIRKQPWELTSEKITMVTRIGAGQFGEVWQGTMQEDAKKPSINVAIKVKKVNNENKTKMDEMYKEARLMRQYKHRNVVTFYGIVNKSPDQVMIVMELVLGGALDEHLRKTKDITIKEKIGYAIDAAVGIVYLHSKGCMHRDIACRNCLIDKKRNIVKISDFGLSKQAESYKIMDHERLPIRWQAPEVMSTRIYTAKCDVYSYGILMWEIFNDGEQPFKGMTIKTVKSKICDPKFRPQVDPALPIVVQRVMRMCWRANPKKRPTMAQVARYLIHAPPEMTHPHSRSSSLKRKSHSGIAQGNPINLKSKKSIPRRNAAVGRRVSRGTKLANKA